MMPELIVKWPAGELAVHFDANVTLLAAALGGGIPVENSCLRGDCQRCSALVVRGHAQQADGKDSICAGEAGLLCQLKSSADIEVELASDPFEVLPAPRLYPVKINGLDWLSDDVVRLRLITPKGQYFEYIGGQYIDVIRQGIRRSYSVFAVDQDSRSIECHIRLVSGGLMSDWLRHEAKIGDLLQIHGPHGRFILRDHMRAGRSYFLATGTGIVPVLSMLRSSSENTVYQLGKKLIIWGNRQTNDAYNLIQFKNICKQYKIDLILAFSKESFTKNIKHVIDGLPNALSDDLIFAAGNPRMVSDARQISVKRGLSVNRFYSDAFSFASAHGD